MVETSGINVLHVDDEPEFGDLAADLLEREDDRFTVETATSATEGLAILAERPVDCVVSDYDMPGMDGIEFLSAVREEHPDLPFILFTGKGSEEIASDAISAGVTDYLRKRTGSEQYELLATRIRTAVGQYRAERKLERQNDLFEKAQDLADVGAWEWNPQDGTGHYTEQVYDIYGVDPDYAGTPEEDIRRFYHPEDRDTVRDAVKKAIESGEHFDIEVRVTAADGTHKWVRTRGDPQFEDGTCKRVRGTIQDITERKRREQKLERQNERLEDLIEKQQATEAKYRTLFENIPVVVWEEDLSEVTGRLDDLAAEVDDLETVLEEDRETLLSIAEGIEIHDVNEYAVEHYDAPSKEVLMENLDKLETERSHEAYKEEFLALAAGETRITLETQARTFEGDLKHELLHMFVPEEYAGDYSCVYVTATDITERKERERELEQQREQLEQREEKLIRLRDYTQELMYAETLSETASIALRAVDEILGFELGAVFTQSETQDGVLELVEVLNRPRMEKMYGGLPAFVRDAPSGTHSALAWEVFETGESVFINDTAESDTLTRKSPFGSLMMYPIGQHGVVMLAATTMDAFTETEEILLDLLATTLKTAFDRIEREQDLRRQRDELKRHNERLDEFASIVSHDLRNPLSMASGRLDLAREECDSPHLDEVVRWHERMEQLIDDLLALAREGESVSGVERVDLADVTGQCWDGIGTDEAKLVTDTDATVKADSGRLRQLVENLFSNAVKHGGDDVTVTVGDLTDGFYIADDGPGISEDERDRALESGYTTAEDGTGFGLSIVRRIAEAHGWEVSITDSDDGGARFEITGVEVVD